MQRFLMILAIVIAIALAIFAVDQRREAEQQAGLAAAPMRALQAYQLYERTPWLAERATLLALDAYARGPGFETASILRHVAGSLPASPRQVPHEDVRFIRFTSDGLLLTGGSDNMLRAWRLDDWSEVFTLEHEGRIGTVAESPDGSRLAVVEDRGRNIYLWDTATGELDMHIEHGREISHISFSRSGKLLVATNYQYPATVWSVADGELLFESGNIDVVNAALDDGEILLVAAGRDAEIDNSFIHAWSLGNGEEVFRGRHQAFCVAISADSSLIASGDNDGHIKLWSTGEQRELRSWDVGKRVREIAFSQDGQLQAKGDSYLWTIALDDDLPTKAFGADNVREFRIAENARIAATLDRKNRVRISDIDTSQEIASVVLPGDVRDIEIDNEARLLATTGRDQPVTVWPLGSAVMRHDGRVTGIVFSPDGRHLVSSGTDGTTRLWNVMSSAELQRFEHDKRVNAVAYDPAGQWFAAGDSGSMIRLWTTDDFNERFRINAGSPIFSLAVNPDSSFLASGGSSARLWMLDVAIGLTPIESTASAVAFSPDGARLATAKWGSVQFWDVETREQVTEFPHERTNVRDVEYSPNGGLLASASSDGTLRIWNLQSEEVTGTMLHDDAVESLAFSPDGSQIATASADGTARTWSVETGEELARFPLDSGGIAVAFSPDGKRLATGSDSGQVRTWQLSMDDVVDDVCSRLTRSLTDAEVAQYLDSAPPAQSCR